MASRDEIQAITAQAIFDNGFRSRLLAAPQKAAGELKIKLTRKEVKYIKSLDPDELQRLAVEIQSLTHSSTGALHWG